VTPSGKPGAENYERGPIGSSAVQAPLLEGILTFEAANMTVPAAFGAPDRRGLQRTTDL